MKKIVSYLVLVFLVSVMSGQTVMADNFQFVTLEYPPLEFKQSNGKAGGVAVEIVQKIMANLGHTVHIKVYPWTRALSMVKKGNADAIFTAYKNPERETFLYYSKNVLVPQILGFYVVHDSPITFDGNLEKLKNKKIGILSTLSYGKKFDDMRNKLTLERGQQLESNFKKLSVGRLDMIVSNIYSGDWTIKKIGMENRFKRLTPYIQSIDSYIAFSKAKGKGHGILRDAFDRELKKLISEGTYKEIMLKFGIKL